MEDGSRGDFYLSAVEKGPYVEYLRSAIDTKKIMYQISREGDVGDSRILGTYINSVFNMKYYRRHPRGSRPGQRL